MEMNAEIDLRSCHTLVMDVLRSPNREEYTRIVFQKNAGSYNRLRHERRKKTGDNSIAFKDSVITIDTTMSSSLPMPQMPIRPPESAPVNFDMGAKLKLRVFIDHSSVEVFVNDRQCAAVRVFPGREDSTGVSLQALGGDAKLLNFDAWQKKSIWESSIAIE
jgi:beta-fructofuranosidase